MRGKFDDRKRKCRQEEVKLWWADRTLLDGPAEVRRRRGNYCIVARSSRFENNSKRCEPIKR